MKRAVTTCMVRGGCIGSGAILLGAAEHFKVPAQSTAQDMGRDFSTLPYFPPTHQRSSCCSTNRTGTLGRAAGRHAMCSCCDLGGEECMAPHNRCGSLRRGESGE